MLSFEHMVIRWRTTVIRASLAFTASLHFSFAAAHSDTLNTITTGREADEQEAMAYLNHLDSFIINAYYGDILSAGAMVRETDSICVEMPEDRAAQYKAGLLYLDQRSPFDLVSNNYVHSFIDLYIFRKRSLTETCMALSEYYFPIFEESLDKYDLPLEFKYLAIVESALNVKAKSRAGAAGLWQFMLRTGRHYDLEINSFIDQRYEVYAATDAACRYFSDLYSIYGNWELVIAAYNCGPGNVNKAIRRSGGKRNYWEIREFLPLETRGYVPAFIAVNYAMNYGEVHGLIPNLPDSLDLITDTIMAKAPLDIAHLSSYFCIDREKMEYLNPFLRRTSYPEDGRYYPLCMPIGSLNAYLVNREEFHSYCQRNVGAMVTESVVAAPVGTIPASSPVTHIVRRGEVLGSIANRYGCSVEGIREWNSLRSTTIYVGQRLTIHPTGNAAVQRPAVVADKEDREIKASTGDIYHVVKSGDTLWDIARMYEGATVSEIRKLNQGLNHRKLKPGDRIKVSSKS